MPPDPLLPDPLLPLDPLFPDPLLVPVLAVVDVPILKAYHSAPKPSTPLPLAWPGAWSPANR